MNDIRLTFHYIYSQYSSNGADNGLAPTRRQAIIWTNDGCFTVAYMRLNELNKN